MHLGVGVTDVGLVVDTVEVLQVVLLVHVLLGLGRGMLGREALGRQEEEEGEEKEMGLGKGGLTAWVMLSDGF